MNFCFVSPASWIQVLVLLPSEQTPCPRPFPVLKTGATWEGLFVDLEFPRTQHLDKGRRDKDGYVCIAPTRGLKTRAFQGFLPSPQLLSQHLVFRFAFSFYIFYSDPKNCMEGRSLRKDGLFYFSKLKEPHFFFCPLQGCVRNKYNIFCRK